LIKLEKANNNICRLLQVKKDAPWQFYESYKDEFPKNVWLEDEVGTKFGVKLHKLNTSGEFIHEFMNVIKHYNLHHGVRLFLSYKGQGVFKMNIIDLNLKFLIYPKKATKYDFIILYS